jgi:heterotetrameric sarcosine oxidase gamma subunit
MPETLATHPAVTPALITASGLSLALTPTRETISIGPFAGCLTSLNTTLGITLPETFAITIASDGIAYSRAAHDQWFATAPEGTGLMSRLEASCMKLAALTNQTDSRVTLSLKGIGARAITSKLVPIDLHPNCFGPSHTALTLAGHIPIILTCSDTETAYDFTVFRSFAQSLHHDILVAMNGGIPNSERV